MANSLLDSLRSSMGLTTLANEANATTITNAGAEFDFAGFIPKILEKARDKNTLFSKIPAENIHTMPAATTTLFLEGDDPVFYNAAENDDEPTAAGPYTASQAGTADTTMTARKAVSRVVISTEMLEDNVTSEDFETYVVNKLAKAYETTIEQYLINGDTATGTGNINAYTATASTTLPYSRHDGLIKASFTNSTTLDGGSLDSGDFRSARAKMGLRGIDPSEIVAVMDPSTYYKLLSLAQVETVEKRGFSATIVSGSLALIDGMEVLVTSRIGLANATGQVDGTTAGNNTKGRIVLVHKPSVHVGFKRQLAIKPWQDSRNDQVGFTASFRYGQALPYAGTTGAKAQALVYNITV